MWQLYRHFLMWIRCIRHFEFIFFVFYAWCRVVYCSQLLTDSNQIQKESYSSPVLRYVWSVPMAFVLICQIYEQLEKVSLQRSIAHLHRWRLCIYSFLGLDISFLKLIGGGEVITWIVGMKSFLLREHARPIIPVLTACISLAFSKQRLYSIGTRSWNHLNCLCFLLKQHLSALCWQGWS